MNLKKRRILITAGPTWVPIDNVRVISNIATAETGTILAREAKKQGANVTLLLGPVSGRRLEEPVKTIHFKFYQELKDKLVKELRSNEYDMVIHSAAVSDYQPEKIYKHKIKSGIKRLTLSLIPTPKIIELIKKIKSSLLVVAFKFEPEATKDKLIKETKKLMRHANLDLAVGNTIVENRYLAYIINHDHNYGPFLSKKNMAEKLIKLICNYPGFYTCKVSALLDRQGSVVR